MKKVIKFNPVLVLSSIILLLFLSSIVFYSITKKVEEKKLKNTPYAKYGLTWPNKQKNLNLKQLALSGEISKNSLVKLLQKKHFQLNEGYKILIKSAERIIDKSDYPSIITFKYNHNLKKDEVIIYEYSKVVYFFDKEVTSDYYPASKITYNGNDLVIDEAEFNHKIIENIKVAFFGPPTVMNIFTKKTVELDDYVLQSSEKHYVIELSDTNLK